jgi:hypothetical protein
VTDARRDLVLYLDGGDTLTLAAESTTTATTVLPGGGQQVDYALYASADHTQPPSATLHVIYGA